MKFPLLALVGGTLASVAPAAAAAPAPVYDGPSLELRGGLGVASMVSSPQRDLGFKHGLVPDLHPGVRIGDNLALELALASWLFPHDGGAGRATLLGGGVRGDLRLAGWLLGFVDGHAGVGLTGDHDRFMFDGGAGLEVWFSRRLALGPFARYGQLVDRHADPKFWATGLSATVTWASEGDEPPALGPMDREREERQREWERTRGRQRGSVEERDSDGDGVVDARDICPYEAAGPHPDPNALGCPSTSAAPSAPPEPPATPEPGSVEGFRPGEGVPGLLTVERGELRLLQPIAFTPRAADLRPSSFLVLRAVVRVLKETPSIRGLSVRVHLGSLPPAESLELSRRRAESVRRFLLDNGIDGDRVEAEGRGDREPIASRMTARGRAENDRVELIILDAPPGPVLP